MNGFESEEGTIGGASHVTWDELEALIKRVEQLERLWRVALENPELVRELAAQALRVDTK